MDEQKREILSALSKGSTREDFWYGKNKDDYPFMLDAQFKKNRDLAVWMDMKRIDQQWVCHECGVQFGKKECGKCSEKYPYCMEKGCKIDCYGCTNNQQHYLGDYQYRLKLRYHDWEKYWISWAQTSLTSMTLDDEGYPKSGAIEVYKIKRTPQSEFLAPFGASTSIIYD